MGKILKVFSLLFLFDLRSLSLMRIGIALVLLIDLVIRFSNLEAHYTDYGVLPLEGLFRLSWNEYFFSLFTMSGSVYFQVLLFGINLYCILCLLAGYRTKIFTILCWVFLLSLHNRNPLIHQGGDDMLRLILFFGIFLPWNYYYSIDSNENSIQPKPATYYSLTGFAYMLQVGYVYFFSAILKSSAEWTSEYSALYYALSLDQIVLPIGRWIYPFEEFLRISTAGVLYIELLLPLVLLIPFYSRFFRLLFISIIFMLHFGIALCLNVGLFPIVGIVSMIGLLPGDITEKLISLFSFRINITDRSKSNISNAISAYANKRSNELPYESKFKRGWMLIVLIFIFNWNLYTLRAPNFVSSNNSFLIYILRLDQHWGMFSPAVFKDDGWFVFSAKTKEGKEIDLLQEGKALTFNKIAAVSGPFKEDRWRKFSENILLISNADYRPYYCSYLMNHWNKDHKLTTEKIDHLQIIYMKEVSLPDYKVNGPSKEILCSCESLK